MDYEKISDDKYANLIELVTRYMEMGQSNLFSGNYDFAIKYYSLCVHMLEDSTNENDLYALNIIATAYKNLGVAFDESNKPEDSLSALNKSIEIARILTKRNALYDLTVLPGAIQNRAALLKNINPEKALSDINECIQIYENMDKNEVFFTDAKLANAINNRGLILKELNRSMEALDDYNQAIDIFNRLKKGGVDINISDLKKIYMNRAALQIDLNEIKKGNDDLDIATNFSIKHDSNDIFQYDLQSGGIYLSRGVALEGEDQYDFAIIEYNKAINIFEELVFSGKISVCNHLAGAYSNRAGAYFNIGKYTESFNDCKKAVEIVENNDLPIDKYFCFAYIYLCILYYCFLENNYEALKWSFKTLPLIEPFIKTEIEVQEKFNSVFIIAGFSAIATNSFDENKDKLIHYRNLIDETTMSYEDKTMFNQIKYLFD